MIATSSSVGPSASVTRRRNVSIVSAATPDGAVKLAVADDAAEIVTDGAVVRVHA